MSAVDIALIWAGVSVPTDSMAVMKPVTPQGEPVGVGKKGARRSLNAQVPGSPAARRDSHAMIAASPPDGAADFARQNMHGGRENAHELHQLQQHRERAGAGAPLVLQAQQGRV